MITDGLTPITFLFFVGAVLAGATLVLLYVVARATRRTPLARLSGRLLLGGAGAYLLLLFAMSFTSRSRVLALGAEKHICEIDCHLAYAVTAAHTEQLAGARVREVVDVRVRFDEHTIAPWRPKDASLTPNSRYVALVDEAGNEYPGTTDGLRRALVPGESYTTIIAFDLPRTARGLRLLLRNNDPETRLMIGHENSLLHGRTFFALPSTSS